MTDAREAVAREALQTAKDYIESELEEAGYDAEDLCEHEVLQKIDAALAAMGETEPNRSLIPTVVEKDGIATVYLREAAPDFTERARELARRVQMPMYEASELASAWEDGQQSAPVIKRDLTTDLEERARDLADDLLGCKGADPEILRHTRPEYAAKIASPLTAAYEDGIARGMKNVEDRADQWLDIKGIAVPESGPVDPHFGIHDRGLSIEAKMELARDAGRREALEQAAVTVAPTFDEPDPAIDDCCDRRAWVERADLADAIRALVSDPHTPSEK